VVTEENMTLWGHKVDDQFCLRNCGAQGVRLEAVCNTVSALTHKTGQTHSHLLELRKSQRELQDQVSALQSKLDSSSASDGYSVLAELAKEIDGLKEQIAQKEERWMELLTK
jgi:peptidoglycan hydrolase CwlO-like protein